MIVYLEKGAFGVSKTTKDGYICQEFPIGNDVEAALMAAIAWEKQRTHGTKEGPSRPPAKRARVVFPPQFKQVKDRDCVLVSYIDKNGRYKRIQQALPELGTEEDMEKVVKAVTKRAHIMAGRVFAHSPA